MKAKELSETNGNPIITIPSHCTTENAKKANDEQAEGIPKKITLIERMRIMILRNLWVNAGVFNGSLGVLKEIVYLSGEMPPALPYCILVQLDPKTYTGPSCHPTIERCVPVFPWAVQWHDNGVHQRTQFPVVMSWALTIDKSQGLTLKYITVDLEGKRNEPALAFVACSRTGAENMLMFDQTPGTFTFNMFTKLKKSKNLISRIESDRQLLQMARETRLKYNYILNAEKNSIGIDK